MSTRVGIWEDIEHDPSFAKQRLFASSRIAILLNAIRAPDNLFDDQMNAGLTPHQIADRIAKEAELIGVVVYDDLHHAPLCRANHWHRKRVPTGPCNCGAAKP